MTFSFLLENIVTCNQYMKSSKLIKTDMHWRTKFFFFSGFLIRTIRFIKKKLNIKWKNDIFILLHNHSYRVDLCSLSRSFSLPFFHSWLNVAALFVALKNWRTDWSAESPNGSEKCLAWNEWKITFRRIDTRTTHKNNGDFHSKLLWDCDVTI